MPIIKSARKRVRQEAVRRSRNRLVKDQLRASIKALDRSIQSGNKSQAAEELRTVQSQLSRAVKKNLLPKNTAARKLSHLNAFAKSIGAQPGAQAAKPAAKKPAGAKKPAAAKAPAAKKV